MTPKQIKRFKRFLKEESLYSAFIKYSKNKELLTGYYWYITDGKFNNKIFLEQVPKENAFYGMFTWAFTKTPKYKYSSANKRWQKVMNRKIIA